MSLIPFEQSLKILRRRLEEIRPTVEKIPTRQALGRVLYAPVSAKQPNPAFRLAAMDGIAVNVSDRADFSVALQPGCWVRINTGERVPEDFNAVIKIEDIEFDGDSAIIKKPVEFLQNIRLVGEDFEADTLLFSSEYQLQAQDLSLLLAAGLEEVGVYRKPVVTFIPTGSEFIDHPVLESNSAMVGGIVENAGGILRVVPPVADQDALLKKALREALSQSDIVILSAGTSKGTHDLSPSVLEEMGKIYFRGVALNPARPVFFGDIGDVPVLGLPGYPAAAYIASFVYLRHLVAAFSGVKIVARREVFLSGEEIPPKDADHFYRVNCFDVDGRVYVRKISKGSGSVFSLTQMDGLVHVPPNTHIKKRDAVRVDLLHDRAKNTWAIRGSGDPVLFRLFDLFRKQNPAHRILFWEVPAPEALENIVERNAHAAVIPTLPGLDLFPPFARQLQDYMMRFRIFTRTVGLVPLREPSKGPVRVAIPKRNQVLWEHWLKLKEIEDGMYLPVFVNSTDQFLRSTGCDAAFADIRFLKRGQNVVHSIQEHLDLVISEGYLLHPTVKNLIDLLLSEEFGAWIAGHRGCDVQSRGLVEEARETTH